MTISSPFLSEEELAALKFHVPKDKSETGSFIASLIVRAPDYKSKFFPRYSIEVGYSQALHGLEEVERKLKSPEQVTLLMRCRYELLGAYAAFKQDDEDRGFKLIQAADRSYVELKRKKAAV